mmetsp:Transcript_15139/g.23956  ORF Transcript_15139/g.23956 Transcript_15139/m.23956 type:complete len:292 (-) Transcript_15139:211-1086(-)
MPSHRTFGCTEGGTAETMMVPLADMANHDFNRPTRWDYNDKKSGFTVRVVRAVGSNAMLTDTYGNKGNDSFLPVYGFCVESNNWNQARFAMPLANVYGLEIPNLRRLHVSKCAYDYNDGKHKYIDASCDTQASGSSRGGKELFSYTRAILLTANELQSLNMEGKSHLSPVSASNERKVLKLIEEVSTRALKRFSTTYEEDSEILKDEKRAPRYSWYRNAILARSGEKSTFIAYQNLAKIMIPLLQCGSVMKLKSHPEYKKLLQASKKENFSYHAVRYIENVVEPLLSSDKP